MKFYTPFELKKTDERGTFEGYGAVFNNTDNGGDIIVPGAFKVSLAAFEAKSEMPMMLWNHNDDEPIGDWNEMKEDANGLYVKGQLWLGQGIANAERAYRVITGRGKKGLSIGYKTKQSDRNKEGNRMLRQLDLHEVSPVTFPMNSKATVLRAKMDGVALDPRTLESLLRDEVGLSAREAKALMSGGYKAMSMDDRDDTSAELKELTEHINKLFQ